MQTYFGYVEKVQEKKTSLLEKKLKVNEFTGRKIFYEIPTVISVLNTKFPADGISNRLTDITML